MNDVARDLQLDWLRCFVEVVDAGSLTAAAPRIHRSQSAVSMQIHKLEEALGRPLLLRGPRQMTLTPAGTELLAHARALLAMHTRALEAVRGPLLTGQVRLGVPDDYAVPYVAPVLAEFAARHVAVEIEVVCEQSTALIPRVQRGELDLALVSRDRPGRGQRVLHEPLVWVASARHEAWSRDPLPVGMYEATSQARKQALAALAKGRRAHRIVYHSASLAGQLAVAHSGLAVVALARCSVPPGLLVLGERHGLPPLTDLEVAVMRSRASVREPAVDALHRQMLQTLSQPG